MENMKEKNSNKGFEIRKREGKRELEENRNETGGEGKKSFLLFIFCIVIVLFYHYLIFLDYHFFSINKNNNLISKNNDK